MSGDSWAMPMCPTFGYPNMYDPYSSQVFMNDLTGFNTYIPPYTGYSMPWMGMNDSIFNCPSYTQIPFTGGYSSSDYYKQMVDYQKQSREADASMKKATRELRQARRNLEDKIANNEQEQIIPAFNEYVNKVRAYNGDEDSSDEDMRSAALDMYEEQTGKSLQTQIRENGSSSFVHGLKEVGFLGFGDKISAEQNIAQITNTKEGRTDSILKSAGNATAGAAWGVTAGLLVPKVPTFVDKVPVLNKVLKGGGSVKVKAALLVGAAAGWLFGKILDKTV